MRNQDLIFTEPWTCPVCREDGIAPDAIHECPGYNEDPAEKLKEVGWSSVRDLHEAYSDQCKELEAKDGFLEWLIRMDEPGNKDRKTVTLTAIVDKARALRFGEMQTPKVVAEISRRLGIGDSNA